MPKVVFFKEVSFMNFDHAHIYCSNLESVITFLTEALGGKLKTRRLSGGKPGAEVVFDNLTIFIKESGTDFMPPDLSASVCGYNHLAFVVDDMHQTLATLCARPDTRLVVEPYMPGKRLCAFIAGPDNLYVELIEETP